MNFSQCLFLRHEALTMRQPELPLAKSFTDCRQAARLMY